MASDDFIVPTEDQVRRKFHQLSKEIAEIRFLVDKHRAEYDKVSRAAEEYMIKNVRPVRERMLKAVADSGLYEKEQQLAALNRFLKFETALPEHKEPQA